MSQQQGGDRGNNNNSRHIRRWFMVFLILCCSASLFVTSSGVTAQEAEDPTSSPRESAQAADVIAVGTFDLNSQSEERYQGEWYVHLFMAEAYYKPLHEEEVGGILTVCMPVESGEHIQGHQYRGGAFLILLQEGEDGCYYPVNDTYGWIDMLDGEVLGESQSYFSQFMAVNEYVTPQRSHNVFVSLMFGALVLVVIFGYRKYRRLVDDYKHTPKFD
ncbi:hypothetical protein [Caldalkalibacillus salinus]|uniref:hypothetical protein n=1 Tax=Caldalkalibacillus salinus TaxID=2803787 RepID=UPI0019205A34|nr:hypothetical protein [Caldalkalibacillus salinus]